MLFALNLSSLMPTRPPWRHISTPFSKPRLPLLLHFHLDGGEGGFPQSPPDPPPLSPLGPPAGDVSLQCQQTILPRLQRTLGRVILLLPLDPMPEAMSLRLPAALPPPPPPLATAHGNSVQVCDSSRRTVGDCESTSDAPHSDGSWELEWSSTLYPLSCMSIALIR